MAERHLQRVARRIVQRAGGEHLGREFRAAAIYRVLVGRDRGPTGYAPCGLAACITAGIGNIAAAARRDLTPVESRVEE